MKAAAEPGSYVRAVVPPDVEVLPVAADMAPDGTLTGLFDEADAAGLTVLERCRRIRVGSVADVVPTPAARGIRAHAYVRGAGADVFVPAGRLDEALRVLRGRCRAVGAYEIDDDRFRIDRDAVWAFLSTAAYWGRDRTRADVETQLDRAWRLVGAYRDGALVGFARGVSDGVAFGYLADVFVLPSARGAGLGKALVEAMIGDPGDGAGGRMRWTLFTADAHDLYTRFGFAPPDATALVRPAPVRAHEAGTLLRAHDRRRAPVRWSACW